MSVCRRNLAVSPHAIDTHVGSFGNVNVGHRNANK